MTKKTYARRCAKVWKKYRKVLELKGIRRTGIATHGICDGAPVNPYDQNVMEHSYTVTVLACIIALLFPNMKQDYSLCTMLALLLHDIGETAIGDIPDDGASEAKKDKNALEYDVMCDILNGFAKPIADEVLLSFSEIQLKLGTLYMLDKLDWIFLMASFEMEGHGGSFDYKETHYELTEQDKHAINVSGSRRPLDAMVVHFLEHTHKFEDREIFIELIKAMYREVDGSVPRWMRKLY